MITLNSTIQRYRKTLKTAVANDDIDKRAKRLLRCGGKEQPDRRESCVFPWSLPVCASLYNLSEFCPTNFMVSRGDFRGQIREA